MKRMVGKLFLSLVLSASIVLGSVCVLLANEHNGTTYGTYEEMQSFDVERKRGD